MSLISRLLGRSPDDRDALRPLWHRVVEIAREKHWYAPGGIADTVAGRFDAITLVLAVVLLRMEREPALVAPSVRLSELFVEDMDGQLRQNGIGDIVVGKHIGRLMGALGGRLGALREALTHGDDGALTEVVRRNATMIEGADPQPVAEALRKLAAQLERTSGEALLAGVIER